ncbi:helix-turn-helix domain-containing protein, partial [Amycolatopsis sp. NPDC000740]
MTGLRERKKEATRVALREAALRLALEHGPANVRVDDIAEAAGVSPRTYNNYFSSREEAIVAAVTADRESRIAAAVTERLPETRLAAAIIDAIAEQYTDPGEQSRDALLLITTNPGLRTAFLDAPAALEDPLEEVIATRIGDPQTARVLA